MGKASRAKKEREKMSPASKRVLKQMKRESKPDVFLVDGKSIYFNPMKKLLDGEKYKSKDGEACTKEMVTKYEQFLKNKMKEYKEKKNGTADSGNKSKD